MALEKILTPPGIASFMNLTKPRAAAVGGEPRYSIVLIFDKKAQATPEFRALQAGVEKAIAEKWTGKKPHGLASPFRDGAEKEGQYDGYHAGDIFISPWSKEKPGVVDKKQQSVLDWSDIYSGWTARANVRPFGYEQAGKRGVSFLLDNVQFLKSGTRLDGRGSAEGAFPDDQTEDEDELI
jgi:Protein of unknown function (DUF2815)